MRQAVIRLMEKAGKGFNHFKFPKQGHVDVLDLIGFNKTCNIYLDKLITKHIIGELGQEFDPQVRQCGPG